MRLLRSFLVGTVGIGALVATADACQSTDPDDGAECHPGDRIQCLCDGGPPALKTCGAGHYGPCACAGATATTPSLGGTGSHTGGVSTYDGGFGHYLGACTVTSDCPDGGVCFAFGTKGSSCTHACTDSSQCEAPSPKCNPKSVCAPPD